MDNQALISWSGGKDSCFALMHIMELGYIPKILLNVLNEEGSLSRSHGLPSAILQAQSKAINLPIHFISSSWQAYEGQFIDALAHLKKEYALSYAVFGDIDLQAHRDWEEKVCNRTGLQALLPLWQKNRKELVQSMLDKGIKTIIVSCNEAMGRKFLGREITMDLIEELESIGIDPCGENGEYHTLVIDAPLFTIPLQVNVADQKLHNHYWFATLALT